MPSAMSRRIFPLALARYLVSPPSLTEFESAIVPGPTFVTPNPLLPFFICFALIFVSAAGRSLTLTRGFAPLLVLLLP